MKIREEIKDWVEDPQNYGGVLADIVVAVLSLILLGLFLWWVI